MKIPCTVCKCDNAVRLEDHNLSLYRCGLCGHAFKDLPKEKQEKYASDYFLEEHSNWFENPNYPLFDFIHQEMTRLKGSGRLKVLDVGCGTGSLLKFLRAKDNELELYGIDLIDNQYPGINFLKGDIMEDAILKKFDVVCNIAVIEHIESPHRMIEKLHNLLLPDGILFTVTDNDDGMMYALARLLKKVGMGAPYDRLYSAHHLQCFSDKSIKLLMEMNGFDLLMHGKRNYPLKAVDYPKADPITLKFYAMSVRIVFFLSTIFQSGVLQTVVCRKKERS